jgi:hypothetical protein
MVERVTVAFPQMLEFIGPKAVLVDSFIASGVHCARVAMMPFLQQTNAQEEQRRHTGFANLALLLRYAMKMSGVTASNSPRIH